MRASAIAEELIDNGEDVVFVGDTHEIPWVQERIMNLNFTRILEKQHDYQSNAKEDVLILDSYTIKISDPFVIRDKWSRIVVIADQETPNYACDLAINPGLENSWESLSAERVISGPRYIPFRKSITKSKVIPRIDSQLKILVVGGGADTLHFSNALCTEIMKLGDNFECNVISDNLASDFRDSRIKVFPPGHYLDVLAPQADLIITTASTSCLEFLAMAKPIGILRAVENQTAYYDQLTIFGAAAPLGRYHQGEWEVDFMQLAQLVGSARIRDALVSRCQNLIDFRGTKRIVKEVYNISK